MKIIKFASFAAVLALICGCATVAPNIPRGGESIATVPMKYKQMTPVSYEYRATGIGCSEVKFLEQYVGKKIAAKGGTMFVENIVDIHYSQSSRTASIFGLKADPVFECEFWGIAVEYEK